MREFFFRFFFGGGGAAGAVWISSVPIIVCYSFNMVSSYKLLNKQGPLDKQQRREAGSLCRSGSAIFFN